MSDPLPALRHFLNRLIPPSELYGTPGAGDELISAQILQTLTSDGARLEPLLQDALDLSGLDLPATLQRLGERHGQALGALIVAMIQCYHRDERVMRSLGMEVRAPFPQGFEMGESDWSLLEPVRSRPRLWRPAS
jgi:hypothetical protein